MKTASRKNLPAPGDGAAERRAAERRASRRRLACIAEALLLLLAGCSGGSMYYLPRTEVNTIGIKKVPLWNHPVDDYTLVYSFENESEAEYDRRHEQQRIIFGDYGYLTETRFLGKDYYLRQGELGYLKISPKLDPKKTVAEFDPPRYITGIAAFQQRLNDRDFLVVYLRQRWTSHTSTLLIFDEKFRIVYQDHLFAAWEIGHSADRIVVKSDDYWYPSKNMWLMMDIPILGLLTLPFMLVFPPEKETINGSWVYYIP